MDISQEKDKIREIIRRSSIRNYFTPLLPKHTEKSKQPHHKKFLLRCPEPKSLPQNSPVSIKNYKKVPILTPINRDSNLNLHPKFFQFFSNNRQSLSIEIPSPASQLLPTYRKSNETQFGITHKHTPERSRKNHSSFEISQVVDLGEEVEHVVGNKGKTGGKEGKFFSISRVSIGNQATSVRKSPSRFKEVIRIPKYVSTGENTDDTSVNGWDIPNELFSD